jgi:ABC-type branched-subunit amino acid transport system ATPase component
MTLLTLSQVSLNFGGVRALTGMNLEIEPGTLHGLVGPNGAGKTTAMNVICGLSRPTQGTMTFQGRPFHPVPHRLARLGLARTFQAAAIIESLDAIGNVLLGAYSATRAGIVGCALRLPWAEREERGARERAEAALRDVGFTAPLHARTANLSTWQRRQIEIARALMSQPRLLLLDEPAAGLTLGEVESFQAAMRRLRERGEGRTSILLIEHNVPLVFGLCDRVTAMAAGADIAHGTPAEVRSHAEVVRSYLGGTATQERPNLERPKPIEPGEVVLQLDGVRAGYGPVTVLHDISLSVRAGETVALFGPNGAGKTTLLNTIVGERRPTAGSVLWHGRPVQGLPVQSIVRLGIGLVPQGRAVMERQSVEDNLLISTMGLRLSRPQLRERLDEIFAQFPGLAQRRRSQGASLSGGERQMLAIAKVLVRRPRILLLDEPSIGLAPAVVLEVQRIVAELAASGMTVIIGEQAVDWVIPVATRAYAIAAGRIVAEGPPETLSDADALAAQYLGAEPTPT